MAFFKARIGDVIVNDSDNHIQDEINKRLTLNLLIQGSAQHAFLTSHYLVRDELRDIDPDLVRLYDQVALAGYVQHWNFDGIIINGWPDRFWRRASRPKHPFSKHPLLSRHGLSLVQTAKKRAYARCSVKGVSRIPFLFTMQFLWRMIRTWSKGAKHKTALIDLAKRTTQQIWGIPYNKLDGAFTMSVEFGQLSKPKTIRASLLRASAAGYGGVQGKESNFRVVGRAWLWPILSHELAKGTAELICMHGLNQLDSATYRKVIQSADRIEYEPWMLQAGPELWRQLLPLFPDDRPVSEMVMYMAMLPPKSLERLMLAVIEDKRLARNILSVLGNDNSD